MTSDATPSMTQQESAPRRPYQPPEVEELGRVGDLTRGGTVSGQTDTLSLLGTA